MSAVIDKGLRTSMAFDGLRRDFVIALHRNPATVIRTPAFGGAREMEVSEVIADSFADVDGDATRNEMAGIVAAAARGEDVQLRASAFIKRCADAYGNTHCDDVANEMDGDE
jgi:hypothetical protein